MTRWILPDAAYSGNDSNGIATDTGQNMADMVRRINKAYGWPSRGTNQLGSIRTSSSGNYYLMVSDSSYADLVARSANSKGLSATEQSNSVTTAPTGDTTTSFYPYGLAYPWPRKVVYCLGDSLTNGVVVTHAENQKIHAQLVDTTDSPQYVAVSSYGYAWDKSKTMSFNYGRDSFQVANPNGEPYGDWTTDFPLKLKNLTVAPHQLHVFHVYLGTNDLAHEIAIDPITDLWMARLVPFISTLKSTYPTAKIVVAKLIARGTSSSLNNRIKTYNDYLTANYGSIGIDAVIDYQNLTGTGVWAGVKILDCNNPGVTASRASSSTVSGISGSTWTTSATHSLVNGTPVTITSTGTMPGGVSSSTAYYARSLSTTTFSIHPTLADANANTNVIAPTSSGSGNITIATSGDSYYSTDNVHMKPAATMLVGAASKAVIDLLR